jgi:uncharacterized protein
MANPSTAHEPSMEEILASIRQIISEDGDAEAEDGAPAAATGRDTPKPSPVPERSPQAPKPADRSQAEAAAEIRSEPASMEAAKPMKPQSIESQPIPVRAEPAAVAASYTSPQENAARRTDHQAPAAQPRPAAPAVAPSRPVQAAPAGDDRTLLSTRSDAAVSGAFNALAHTILAQNARTLEDLVTEMLQPMLKDWLDENLPSLVERLVKEEIDRVSRRR